MDEELSLSGCPVVRQEFSQSCDWVVGDAGKNVLEPGKRIHADALAGSYEAPQHRGCFAAFIAAEEDPSCCGQPRGPVSHVRWRCCRFRDRRRRNIGAALSSSSGYSAPPVPPGSWATPPPGSRASTGLRIYGFGGDAYHAVSEFQAFGTAISEPGTVVLAALPLVGLFTVAKRMRKPCN